MSRKTLSTILGIIGISFCIAGLFTSILVMGFGIGVLIGNLVKDYIPE